MQNTGHNVANPELHMSALQSLPISKDFLCSGHCSRKMHSTQMTERARIKPKKSGDGGNKDTNSPDWQGWGYWQG